MAERPSLTSAIQDAAAEFTERMLQDPEFNYRVKLAVSMARASRADDFSDRERAIATVAAGFAVVLAGRDPVTGSPL